MHKFAFLIMSASLFGVILGYSFSSRADSYSLQQKVSDYVDSHEVILKGVPHSRVVWVIKRAAYYSGLAETCSDKKLLESSKKLKEDVFTKAVRIEYIQPYERAEIENQAKDERDMGAINAKNHIKETGDSACSAYEAAFQEDYKKILKDFPWIDETDPALLQQYKIYKRYDVDFFIEKLKKLSGLSGALSACDKKDKAEEVISIHNLLLSELVVRQYLMKDEADVLSDLGVKNYQDNKNTFIVEPPITCKAVSQKFEEEKTLFKLCFINC